MEQTISMGMAAAITACALLVRAVGPALLEAVENKARLRVRESDRRYAGGRGFAVMPVPAHNSRRAA